MIAWCSLAMAQPVTDGAVPTLNAQRFRPTLDGRSTLWTDDARPSRGQTVQLRSLLHYADEPLAYTAIDGSRTRLVRSVLQADVMGSLHSKRARIGVALPVYLWSRSDVADGQAGLGDVALDGRVALLTGPASWGLALQGRLTLPTSTVDTALGTPRTGWEAAAVVDRPFGRWLWAANVGVKGAPNVELENVALNDFVVVRTALAYAFSERAGAALELAGDLPLRELASTSTPIEWLLSGYLPATDVLDVRAGFGTAITGGIGAPDWRAVLGLGLRTGRRPRARKEAPSPVEPKAELGRDTIDLRDRVYFDTDRATIQPRSYALLDEVAELLVDHPELTLIRIEGHTDERGDAAYNLDLSTRRAAAVRKYLIDRGVAPNRLQAVGLGEGLPLDTRSTREAWERNRRVDFYVIERAYH
ncbi:MAG: OmpA family protein [Myxococcota bacterium]